METGDINLPIGARDLQTPKILKAQRREKVSFERITEDILSLE
jgi:hypothetical protein